MDERFKMHRLYSTRLATIIGSIMIGALFFFEYLSKQILRWDLFIILLAMAVSKIVAMLYYRRTN
jgi:hypothetical protein